MQGKYEFDKKQSSILRDISKIAKKVRETHITLCLQMIILNKIVQTCRLICKGFLTT